MRGRAGMGRELRAVADGEDQNGEGRVPEGEAGR